MADYTKEQFWKLYEKLPQELKNAVFSEETANSIYDICEKNNILKNVSEVAKYAGRVLLGILPPGEYQRTLEKEVELKQDIAKKVAQEISRFVFYPVKESLMELYKIEGKPTVERPTMGPPKVAPVKEKSIEVEEKKSDIYREITE